MNHTSNKEEIIYLCKDEGQSLNPKKEALTVEKLRTFEGFENTPEDEAEEIIYTIDTLCRIVQEYLMNQNLNENNNLQNLAA